MQFDVYRLSEQQAMEFLKNIKQTCRVCGEMVAMFPPDTPIRHILLHVQGEKRADLESHLSQLNSLTTSDVLSMVERYGIRWLIGGSVQSWEV
jgi:hypothetical protein